MASTVGFYVILIVGTYLGLTSIMALPRLLEHDTQSAEVSADNLANALNALGTTKADLDRAYVGIAKDSLVMDPSSLRPSDGCPAAAAAAATGAAAGVTTVADGGVADAAGASSETQQRQQTDVDAFGWAGSFAATWPNDVDRSDQLRTHAIQQQSRGLRTAVDGYRVKNVQLQGSREERAHYLLLEAWFAREVQMMETQSQACAAALRDVRPDFVSWDDLVRRTRHDACDPSVPMAEVGRIHTEAGSRFTWLSEKLRHETDPACTSREWTNAPDPPQLGQSLGALRAAFSWLLNADSLPLTVIVGMIGFGLLGSVISTFVRERNAGKGDAPPVTDLMAVVIRGFCAAIVVYLSVEGGLGILSSATTDVNPYVTLFVCFVSAVYSEVIWARVAAYLKTQVAPDPAGGDAASQEKAQQDKAATPMPTPPKPELAPGASEAE